MKITNSSAMKNLLPLSIFTFIMSILLQGCSPVSKSPIEGTWRLAFEFEIRGESSTCIFPDGSRGSELKMWAGNRWSLVGVFLEDSVITDNYAGGTFTLEGNDYKEIVEFHSAPEYLGQTVPLFLEIRNDTLVQIWPVAENGDPVAEHHYMEKWVRMKSE
jgi:hypothetical protein